MENEQQIDEQNHIIGEVVIVRVHLPTATGIIKGRVDTGAEVSSLHADQVKIVGNSVQFVNKELSPNVITMPLASRQAVQSSDGGTEYRPVVHLDIEVDGKPMSKMLFNLNDRGHMEYKMLIGQNVLEKTGYLIDPAKNANNSTPETQQTAAPEQNAQQQPVEQRFENVDNKQVILQQISNLMEQGDITFKDLIQYVRTEALQRLDNIEH